MEIRPGLPSGTYGQVSARPPRKEEGSRPCISRLVATDLEFAFELCFGVVAAACRLESLSLCIQ